MSEDVHGLIGAYALDAVTPAERAEFEAHLAACEECRAEVASLRDAASALADAEAATPPASLRAAVLAQVAVTAQVVPAEPAAEVPDAVVSNDVVALAPKPRQRRAGRWALAAASVLVLAAIGVGVGNAYQAHQESIAMERDVMMVTTAPDAHTMDLALGTGHLVMSSSMDGVAVMGQDAPMPADGMEYQLWVMMDDGSAMPGPAFMPEAGGEFMTVMHSPMDGVVGFAVTEEPAGGSAQPTGEQVAVVHL